jgi:hypothetical protein
VEIKSPDAAPTTGLKYYTDRLRPREALQLVLGLDRSLDKSGIKVRPLGTWLEKLGGG